METEPGPYFYGIGDLHSWTVAPSDNRWYVDKCCVRASLPRIGDLALFIPMHLLHLSTRFGARYFHYEGASEFNRSTSSTGNEFLGYADATFTVGPGDDFKILTLTQSNSKVIELDLLRGDNRGGIAISPTTAFDSGDLTTAIALRDLSTAAFWSPPSTKYQAPALTPTITPPMDGLCSNLETVSRHTYIIVARPTHTPTLLITHTSIHIRTHKSNTNIHIH